MSCHVSFRLELDGEWEPFQCVLSKKILFGDYEANHRARRLVREHRKGEARVRRVTGEEVALWRWSNEQREAVKVYGPDL